MKHYLSAICPCGHQSVFHECTLYKIVKFTQYVLCKKKKKIVSVKHYVHVNNNFLLLMLSKNMPLTEPIKIYQDVILYILHVK